MCYLHETTIKWRYVKNTGKHMILLTRKAHLTEKVLWHYELTNKTEIGWNKKTKSFEDMIKQRYFFFIEKEQALLCKCGAIPLRSAFPQKLLQKCWIVLRLLTMFAPNFFGLSHCWSLNKDDRSIGKNIPPSYFSVFARVS
jgi:hypothetical protein